MVILSSNSLTFEKLGQGANTSDRERLAMALTLVGAHGLIPNGIPLAVHPRDQGQWWLGGGELGS
jgi:hypothetical protein